MILILGLGSLADLRALALAPGEDAADVGRFYAEVFGSLALNLLTGVALYARSRRNSAAVMYASAAAGTGSLQVSQERARWTMHEIIAVLPSGRWGKVGRVTCILGGLAVSLTVASCAGSDGATAPPPQVGPPTISAPIVTPNPAQGARVTFSVSVQASLGTNGQLASLWLDCNANGQEDDGEVVGHETHACQAELENLTSEPITHRFAARVEQVVGGSDTSETVVSHLPPAAAVPRP